MHRLRPLAAVWPLLFACALGCGWGDSREVKEDEEPAAKTPAEMLVGKWLSADKRRGYEFFADGTVKRSVRNGLPDSGNYKIDGDVIEWKLAGEETERYRFAVTAKEVTFSRTDGKGRKVSLAAVDAYPAELNHPNRKPNERQRQWIVGGWRGNEENDVHHYAFRPDGTFSHLEYDGGLKRTKVEMGVYRVHPDADNFLELTYLDTERTETIHAEIGEKELVLGASGQKLQRTDDKEERTRPVRQDVLTAFALYRECAADPAKAREKYVGKVIEVAGGVESRQTRQKGDEYALYTGKAARLKCLLAAKDVETADAMRELDFARAFGKMQFATLRGKVESVAEEEGEKGPVLVVRLSGCKVVARSEMRPD